MIPADQEVAELVARNIDKILEAPGFAIFLANLDGKILWTNRPAADLLGYKRRELINKTVQELTPDFHMKWEEARVLHSAENDQKGIHIAGRPIIRKDGSIVMTSVHMVVLDNSMPHVMAVVTPNEAVPRMPLPPSLTATERRLAKYIAFGMSSKEIASSIGVSLRTVENHRYHLHKKLSLPPKTSLYEGLKLFDIE